MALWRVLTRSLTPSLIDLAFLYPVIFLLSGPAGVSNLLRDGDTGWHVRAGEWMLNHGEVLKTDVFSYTKPGAPWFAWQWLSEIIFAGLHQRFGLAGVVALSVVILCATSGLLFSLANRRSNSSPLAIGFTFLAIAATTVHWHARPLLFSMCLTVVFLYLLWLSRDGERIGPLILLPLLSAIWVNLHGGFITGILLVGAYAAAQLCEWLLATAPPDTLRRFRRLALTAAACLAATLINPNTYHVHVFIAQYLRQSFLDRIPEFMSPDFHARSMWTFESMLFAGLVFTFWNVRRGRYADALLIIVTGHMALVAVRNVPIFVLIAAPSASVCMREWLESLQTSTAAAWLKRGADSLLAGMSDLVESSRLPVIGLLGLTLAIGMILRPNASGRFHVQLDARLFPAAATDYLATLPAESHIFTNDEWGDYLTYRLFPRTRVYVDGRSDFYGQEFMEAYGNTVEGRGDWTADFARYGVETVLMPVDSALVSILKLAPGWVAVYDDHRAIIFRHI